MNLREELELAKIEENEAAFELEILHAEDAELERQIAELAAQQLELKRKLSDKAKSSRRWELNTTIRMARRRKDDAEAQLRVEEENERVQRQVEADYLTLEQLSKDAIWRKGNAFGDKALKHQIDGAYVLASSRRAILADSMGVGKTLTSIATLDLIGAKRILIVCPGEVMSGFEQELRKWSERPPILIGRKPKKETRAILNMLRSINAPEYVVIINYEAWSRDRALLTELESMLFDTVICDEAHRLKETDTAAYKGVEQIVLSKNICELASCRKFFPLCPHKNTETFSAQNVYLLTGTPILNRPEEIYALLHILRPLEFQTKAQFVRNYCERDITGKTTFRPGGMATLASRLSGSYLRRTRETAGIVLPKQETVIHSIELDPAEHPEQIELLEQLEMHAQIEIDEGRAATVMSKLALITRQRQGATWPGNMKIKVPRMDVLGMPVYDEWNEQVFDLYIIPQKYWKSAKMDAAFDLLEELVEDGQRVVVFSQFKEALYELQRRCASADGIRSIEYHGDTPPEVRDEVKRNFDRSNHEESKWDAVLCHYKTGGVGLNMTAATQIIILDEEWNPGMNEQAYGRIHRIGQTEETTIHIFRTTNTVDEWMADLNEEKGALVDGFNRENASIDNQLLSILQKKVRV